MAFVTHKEVVSILQKLKYTPLPWFFQDPCKITFQATACHGHTASLSIYPPGPGSSSPTYQYHGLNQPPLKSPGGCFLKILGWLPAMFSCKKIAEERITE
jgi:hypothetical protein